jgi:ABC-type phosphate/phosphonate transport system substrate-binding protein
MKTHWLPLTALVYALCLTRSAWAEPEARPTIHTVISERVLTQVSPRDASAAIQAWMSIFLRRIEGFTISETSIVSNFDALEQIALTNGADLFMLQPIDYLRLRDKTDLVPLVVGAIGGSPHFHSVLLVSSKIQTRQLADLRGMRISLDQGSFDSAPMLWLQTRLHQNNLPATSDFFSDISVSPQTSNAVMRAFFDQADVCLVDENSFATMSELNPQLRDKLRIVERTPPLCQGMVCITRETYTRLGDQVKEGLELLHKDAKGRQLLNLFGVDELLPFAPSFLKTEELLLQGELNTLAPGNRHGP